MPEADTTQQYRYWAFISYSSQDRAWARWLHHAIETYGIPAQLVSHETPVGEPAPKRFHPLFLDHAELPASADLGREIENALRASRYLIVVCSPAAAQSRWVNREIEKFGELGRSDRVLVLIVDGEPNSGDARECFPVALRQMDPIAADARRQGDGKINAKLKLLSGMLGVSFDALKQRDAQRQIRRLRNPVALLERLLGGGRREEAAAATKIDTGLTGDEVTAVEAPPRTRVVPEVPGGQVDRVQFTVTSPPGVLRGASFVIDVWAHFEIEREAVIQRAREALRGREIHVKSKGPVEVPRGAVLSVRLKVEGLIIEDPEDMILWDGTIGNATFSVMVPEDATEGPRCGLATIYTDGLQIARIHFELQVGRALLPVSYAAMRLQRHRKAFASYASADRGEVLPRIQGMQKADPQLDIFLDVISLRSGQYWEQELWKVIPSNDVFYLFWSGNAQKSEWVEKEWRCALQTRGLDFIDPVPLVSPEEVPPPPELVSKHFNDWTLAYVRSKRPSSCGKDLVQEG